MNESSDGDAIGRILRDRALVSRVDEQNRFFELELTPGASPQELLRRLVSAGATVTTRPTAASAARRASRPAAR